MPAGLLRTDNDRLGDETYNLEKRNIHRDRRFGQIHAGIGRRRQICQRNNRAGRLLYSYIQCLRCTGRNAAFSAEILCGSGTIVFAPVADVDIKTERLVSPFRGYTVGDTCGVGRAEVLSERPDGYSCSGNSGDRTQSDLRSGCFTPSRTVRDKLFLFQTAFYRQIRSSSETVYNKTADEYSLRTAGIGKSVGIRNIGNSRFFGYQLFLPRVPQGNRLHCGGIPSCQTAEAGRIPRALSKYRPPEMPCPNSFVARRHKIPAPRSLRGAGVVVL